MPWRNGEKCRYKKRGRNGLAEFDVPNERGGNYGLLIKDVSWRHDEHKNGLTYSASLSGMVTDEEE